jgi:hypothetical protein
VGFFLVGLIRCRASDGLETRPTEMRDAPVDSHVTVTMNVCVAVLPVLSVAVTVIVEVPAAW